MNTPTLETKRLILRKFTENDLAALYQILSDEEVNRFLPWFPLQSMEETKAFFEERYLKEYDKPIAYRYAVCLKSDNIPVGYIGISTNDSFDLGYGLRKEFWRNGITREAGAALVEQARRDGLPYLTATHDVNNPRSGNVMKALGMHYQYSYNEFWLPKKFFVTFRMYQLNLDGNDGRVYQKYWDQYPDHFIEKL
ncbi:MAG: GNAT family N-acetyltransferase [Firmicutes bacterium]|nr:GNAT family N-acetyltransferase [Bacillota bacterium]